MGKKFAKTLFSIAILLALYSVCVGPVNAAGIVHLVDSTGQYNIRIDGVAAGDQLGYNAANSGSKAFTDIDSDGKVDLVIGAAYASNNGRNRSGSVYIVSGAILAQYSGTGNTIDLSNPQNYSLRIDGAVANDILPSSAGILFGDLDNDGKEDMLVSCSYADSMKGRVYLFRNTLIAPYLATRGNTLDLASNSSFNLALQGQGAGDVLGNIAMDIADLDDDGKNDIYAEAHHADNNGAETGSVFVVSNPILNSYAGTGNIVSMNTPSNYMIRYDGRVGQTLGGGAVRVGDYNGDGKIDLFLASDYTDYNGRSHSGSIWIVEHSRVAAYRGTTGNIVDIGDSSQWIVRIDGAVTEDRMSYANSLMIRDVTNDGKQDIVVGSFNADNSSRADSGSLWLISNSTFGSFTTTGNLIDLADTSKFLARIDGEKASDNFTFASLGVFDVNGDGRMDIVSSAKLADTNGADSGAVYVFLNSLINSWTTPGTVVDLANSNSYSIRYDGNAGQQLQFQNGYLPDLNGDGLPDFSFNSRLASYNSRASSGSYFIFYNFPHTISISQTGYETESPDLAIDGQITAPNSVTTVANVQYSVDSNDPAGSWSSCTAQDGSFNGTTESFRCSVNGLSKSSHSIYVRAVDTNGVYTAQQNYTRVRYNFGVTQVSGNSSDSKRCSDSKLTSTPDLFQINTTTHSAKLYFTPLSETNRYYISYSEGPNAERYGADVTLAREGVQSYTVDALKPNTTYYFKVRGQKGCMPGEWSTIMKAITSNGIFYKGGSSGFSTQATESPQKSNTATLGVETQLKKNEPTAFPTHEVGVTKTPDAPNTQKTCFLLWCW